MATSQTNEDPFRCVFGAVVERSLDAFAATHGDNVSLHNHDEGIYCVEATSEHERTLYETSTEMEYPPEGMCFDSRHAMNAFSLVRRKDEHREFGVDVFR